MACERQARGHPRRKTRILAQHRYACASLRRSASLHARLCYAGARFAAPFAHAVPQRQRSAGVRAPLPRRPVMPAVQFPASIVRVVPVSFAPCWQSSSPAVQRQVSMSVYFGGSRSLAPSPLLAQVVRAVLAAGQSVHVGCSAGADQQVIQGCSSSFSQARVFAAFSPSGAGAWSGSAVQAVQAWARAGGAVAWLAGGSLAVPLAARLIQRSLAALAGCSAAVFFCPGAGSLAVAAHAIAQGIPVFAFSPAAPAAPRGCAGRWVASSFMGFACWQWQPAQLSLF